MGEAADARDAPTAALASFVAGLDFDDLPTEVVEHAKTCLIDTVGCGIFGATLSWTGILVETLDAVDGAAGGVDVFGGVRGWTPPHAALVNGSAIHAFELDDLHPRSILHPGSVVLPAALALAGVRGAGASGKQLLTAMVAGYEVGARVGMTMGAAHLVQGWHPTGTHGTLAAAAAAGRMLGLPADRQQQALGIAGTQSSGLMAAQFSAMVKRFHAGRAAQSGVYAALLAARGYTGIDNLFEATYGGYGPTFSPVYRPEALTAGLNETWETLAVGFKPYSTNGSCHPAIDALLDLRQQHGLDLDSVSAVRLMVSTATKEHVGWHYTPGSVTTAQMNLPYIVAVVLADGDAFVRQFDPHRITDPVLVAFTERVSVEADPAIDALGDAGRHHTRLELELADGRLLRDERAFARGSRLSPLARADVEEKFTKLVQDVVPREQAEELVELLLSLEQLHDLTRLSSLITSGSGAERN